MAIRTVPVYVYGLIFIRVTGPGSFAGVLTMMMCSIGLLTKRFTVAVDNWNMAAWNACKCAGTGFIADKKNGFIVTNSHMISPASIGSYFITFFNGQ